MPEKPYALTGRDGGKTRARLGAAQHPGSQLPTWAVIEDAHMIVCHMIGILLHGRIKVVSIVLIFLITKFWRVSKSESNKSESNKS